MVGKCFTTSLSGLHSKTVSRETWNSTLKISAVTSLLNSIYSKDLSSLFDSHPPTPPKHIYKTNMYANLTRCRLLIVVMAFEGNQFCVVNVLY